jgi:hypothetical protein
LQKYIKLKPTRFLENILKIKKGVFNIMILAAGDYDNMLRDSLIQKLNWLEEEFSVLFSSKKRKYSQKDKVLARDMITDITECIESYEDVRLHDLLIDTLNSIRSVYSELF